MNYHQSARHSIIAQVSPCAKLKRKGKPLCFSRESERQRKGKTGKETEKGGKKEKKKRDETKDQGRSYFSQDFPFPGLDVSMEYVSVVTVASIILSSICAVVVAVAIADAGAGLAFPCISLLRNRRDQFPRLETRSQIFEDQQFHFLLGLVCCGSDVREQHHLGVIEQLWFDARLVLVYVEPSRTHLLLVQLATKACFFLGSFEILRLAASQSFLRTRTPSFSVFFTFFWS